ncbi:hypothetical protein HPB48_014174 [Haemaphysalis longicornis]|uniref:Aspartate aminotransferase n=1 Tax=Haemaphysalis longicornis TaxID=44386 RepID=A0A9J6FM07_HAELO|nr:hypothetical protein HPB48_014174 [Haemaphysalis longicornis]
MSRFSCVEAAPPVEIFALMRAYRADTFAQKVDLGVGAYRTEEAKPWVLPVVRKVEEEMAVDSSLNHEYLGQLGLDDFSKAAVRMLLGDDNPAIKEGQAVGVQCLSGTGSLRVGADLLCKHGKFTTIYVSTPTWPNHVLVFKHSGFQNIKYYRYWDAKNRCLDFNGMIEDLENAPPDSVVVLHACAHNPTGIDPTQDQWKKIAEVMKGFELFCAQSFAKNFGLYNERIGNLLLVVNDKTALTNVLAQITLLVRGNYSNPPNHGARIVSRVLNSPDYFEEWKGHIQTMANRIITMRKALQDKLHELGTPGSWEHITKQIGMFSYTGLNPCRVILGPLSMAPLLDVHAQIKIRECAQRRETCDSTVFAPQVNAEIKQCLEQGRPFMSILRSPPDTGAEEPGSGTAGSDQEKNLFTLFEKSDQGFLARVSRARMVLNVVQQIATARFGAEVHTQSVDNCESGSGGPRLRPTNVVTFAVRGTAIWGRSLFGDASGEFIGGELLRCDEVFIRQGKVQIMQPAWDKACIGRGLPQLSQARHCRGTIRCSSIEEYAVERHKIAVVGPPGTGKKNGKRSQNGYRATVWCGKASCRREPSGAKRLPGAKN